LTAGRRGVCFMSGVLFPGKWVKTIGQWVRQVVIWILHI